MPLIVTSTSDTISTNEARTSARNLHFSDEFRNMRKDVEDEGITVRIMVIDAHDLAARPPDFPYYARTLQTGPNEVTIVITAEYLSNVNYITDHGTRADAPTTLERAMSHEYTHAWQVAKGIPQDEEQAAQKENTVMGAFGEPPREGDPHSLNPTYDDSTNFAPSPQPIYAYPPVFGPIPPWFNDPADRWGDALDTASPLVLDLDGDGIELTEFDPNATVTFFDIDGDGFAEQTAWVDADDGLLAIDLNENGSIDSADELFGSTTVDGFAMLQVLDTNGDHIVDQYDDAWSDLVVWQDLDGDANTDDGELISLATLDIVSFDLASISPSTSTVNGNPISHVSTFKYGNGSTDIIADAWFVHDAANTAVLGEVDIDARTLSLPILRGFGEIYDLDIAMSQNEDLLELVEDFATTWDYSRFADRAALIDDVEEILFTWANVDEVDPSSRGGMFDARKLEFMEKFFGENYLQLGLYPDPWNNASYVLENTWAVLTGELRAQLFLQVGAASLFANDVLYNPWTRQIEGDMALSSTAIDDLEVAASQIGVDAKEFWTSVAEFLDYSKRFYNFSGTEDGWLDDAIYDTDPALSWAEIKLYKDAFLSGNWYHGTSGGETLNGGVNNDTMYGYAGADTINGLTGHDLISGGSGNDILNGGDQNDVLYGDEDDDTLNGDAGNDELHGYTGADTLNGGDGTDTLYGEAGNDILVGGAGGDFAYGGNDNDTFVFTAGEDFYDGGSGTDVITLPSGIVFGDLEFARQILSTGDFLNITVGSLGAIQTPFFNSAYGYLAYERIDSIVFHDTSTYDPSSFTELTTFGTMGDDSIWGIYTTVDIDETMYGRDGNDYLEGVGGHDVMDGGNGNDWLKGGAGNDTYIASAGYDIFNENGYGGTDTIVIPDAYDPADVSLLRRISDQYDLEITISGLGQIRVMGQFNYSSGSYIEYLDFDGLSPIDLTTLQIETVGTSGNDFMGYIYGGASEDDIMDGRDGDDYLQGMTGDDTYFFSAGTDTIQESGDGFDTIAFRPGVLPEDIIVYRGPGNYFTELVVEDQYGNKLKSMQHFTIATGYDYSDYSIEEIVFADNTTWVLSAMEIETRGTGSADYIDGTTAGDASQDDTMYGYGGADVLNGYGGDDVMDGGAGNDALYGGADNDVYIFDSGLDYTYEQSGMDRLHISGGTTINDISVSNSSSWDAKVVVNASTDEITIGQMRSHSSYQVETISFDDGFSTTLPDYNTWSKGTSGNNTLTGTSGHDVIIGYAGDDTLSGAADNDDIHGGTGADTLNGGNGADLLHGGTGDDALYGNDGLDTLFGGAGADDFIFESASAFNHIDVIKDFNANDNDAIDIADVLDTYYTAGVDVLTDFVQITTNGANSELRVDTTGSASFGSGTLIAVIEGVTGLTDEVALATAGRLIAA